jgi:hypothetical protein
MRNAAMTFAAVSLAAFSTAGFAADAEISSVGNVSNKLQVIVKPDDAADVLRILTSTNLSGVWSTNASSSDPGTNGPLVGYTWASNLLGNSLFVKAEIKPLSSQRQLAAHVLSRLAYGPTPYEMGRILGFVTNVNGSVTNVTYGEGIPNGGIGVDAWINEQLDPQSITEDVTNQFTAIAPIAARFGGPNEVILTNQTGSGDTNNPGSCNFHDFKAWYAMHAIGARRQTLEVLLYWLENHMVSAWTTARQTFQGSYNGVGGQIQNHIPTKMEIEEHLAYRSAMMRTNITFRELLRLQHESQSMTVYLDTNDSVGNGNNVANENYGREIMELYAMGVDNGYDQGDITAISLAWTGWDVQKVAPADVGNLFAFQNGSLSGQARSNSQGVYKLQFRNSRHGNSNLFLWYHRASIGALGNNYPNGVVSNNTTSNGMKRVSSRFNGTLNGGMTPPYNYANKNYGTNTGNVGRYSLFIPSTQAGTDAQRTNKVYTIMDHMADLPYTQEFICVKLCRLLVHDGFEIGYDFSDGVVTPEEQLVWNCMMAWETNGVRYTGTGTTSSSNTIGQIYKVIKTITDSSLFRSEASYRQKLRDPLEYTMAAVRALRVASNDVFTANNFTADSLGYPIVAGNSAQATAYPLNRMGLFLIFDRDAPDGYPEVGPTYVGASGLVERARWVNSVMYPTYNTLADGIVGGNNTKMDVSGAMDRFLSATARQDAEQVVRLFLRLLFPGEGEANMDGYRRIGLSILNQTSTGTASPWNPGGGALSVANRERIQRMVAAFMSMPRFSEQ